MPGGRTIQMGKPQSGLNRTSEFSLSIPAKEIMSLDTIAGKTSPKQPVVTSQEVVRKLRFDYTYASREATDRMLDSLTELIEHFKAPRVNITAFLQDAAKLIHKQLRIKEVSIGVRSPVDGLYRYHVMSGMREFVWSEHKSISYTKEDFGDFTKWGGFTISEYTRLFLFEEKPYLESEKGTFDAQMGLRMRRKTPDAYVEGDYLDVYIQGRNREVVGWIETGGTWDGKLPDAQGIKWMEFVGSVLAIALMDWDGK